MVLLPRSLLALAPTDSAMARPAGELEATVGAAATGCQHYFALQHVFSRREARSISHCTNPSATEIASDAAPAHLALRPFVERLAREAAVAALHDETVVVQQLQQLLGEELALREVHDLGAIPAGFIVEKSDPGDLRDRVVAGVRRVVERAAVARVLEAGARPALLGVARQPAQV